MSHNHYLECRACGVRNHESDGGTNTPRSSYSRLSRVGGDALVEQALAVRSLCKGVDSHFLFAGYADVWLPFVAEHARCNAFWEVCHYGPERKCGEAPRRILVKGAQDPECGRCHGRRLVACPDCLVGRDSPEETS